MDAQAPKISFAECLLLTRRRSGLRQKTVAQRSGLDPSYLASLENARRPPPSPEVLARILDGLDASPEDRRALEQLALSHHLKAQLSRRAPPELAEVLFAVTTLSAEQLKATRAFLRHLTSVRSTLEQEATM
ncbi:helix-turn-helix domain-containing protein [Paraburkholderia tagetis]|uniref:Helix-turn-helix domain-containing protein n=1 Tax=Paraburkholderia tagetis TaxID=2913261 RepID=A0A9X1UMQ8_9BURK|nr:helix-turn-helix transcriptional regulator [Paraburkholderia tagetis]MCG5078266.1 helix-turn-helix domain-containing protein [Paraburkholderia tagetis]